MCKVIAITNQKGGCAKTNVTVIRKRQIKQCIEK